MTSRQVSEDIPSVSWHKTLDASGLVRFGIVCKQTVSFVFTAAQKVLSKVQAQSRPAWSELVHHNVEGREGSFKA